MIKTILKILIIIFYSIFSFGQCPTPGGLFTTNITSSNALANWTPVNNVDHYKIHYRVFGASSWNNLGNIGMNDSTRNLPLLQPSTTYEWEIMAFCDSTNQLGSSWSVSDTFTTISFTPSPFNPLIINTIASLECNTHTQLSLRVSQIANEADIDTTTIISNGGAFDISSMNKGDSVGFATITNSTQTIIQKLIVDSILNPNYAIINSLTNTGILIGSLSIENITSGIKVLSAAPEDGNNYTSGYISEVHFTNHFITPPVAGPLIFYTNIISELNDQINDSSIFAISCENTSTDYIYKDKKILAIYNILGIPSDKKLNTMLIFYYSDGSTEKKFILAE